MQRHWALSRTSKQLYLSLGKKASFSSKKLGQEAQGWDVCHGMQGCRGALRCKIQGQFLVTCPRMLELVEGKGGCSWASGHPS